MQNILRDIKDILWSPIAMANRHASSTDNWQGAIIIVVLTALMHIAMFLAMQASINGPVSSYLFHLGVADDLLRAFDNFKAINSFLSLAGGASIIPFWVVGTVVMTCWAVLLNGQENFKKVAILYGYAHIPLLLYSIIVITIVFFYPPVAEIQNAASTDIFSIATVLENYRNEILQTPSMKIVVILSYAAQLWSLVLLAVCASVVQKMSYAKSALAVCFYGVLILTIGRFIG